jgi:hypothetical protein
MKRLSFSCLNHQGRWYQADEPREFVEHVFGASAM